MRVSRRKLGSEKVALELYMRLERQRHDPGRALIALLVIGFMRLTPRPSLTILQTVAAKGVSRTMTRRSSRNAASIARRDELPLGNEMNRSPSRSCGTRLFLGARRWLDGMTQTALSLWSTDATTPGLSET